MTYIMIEPSRGNVLIAAENGKENKKKGCEKMEFKLRVWDKNEKQMYNVKSIWLSESGGKELTVKSVGIGEVAIKDMTDVEIIRPTHFKNHRGEEYWEGDILSNGYVRVLIEYRKEIGAFVGWYTHVGKENWELLSDLNGGSWRVAGNKYENPWMLNQ